MQTNRRRAQLPCFVPAGDPVQRAADLVRASAVRSVSRGELAAALACLGMTPDERTLERVRAALEHV